MKLRFLFASMLAACTAMLNAQEMPAEAMQPLPIDPQTTMGTLPNALTYYVRHNEHPKGQANFYIAQKVGSVLEEDNQRGLAHFLEHMCFNGTKNFPGNGIIRYLESIGVKFGQQLNAYTSIDETVYNINNVPTANTATIDSVLLILHDWSNALTLDPKEIDKERGVIHEEWRMRSSASMRIFERQLPRVMSNSRPGNRLPIGTMEVVDNFPYQTLRDYYEKWYRPDQQAIIVVGDLDVNETVERIKNLFSPIQMPANAAKREYFSVPDNNEPIIATDKDKEQAMPVIMVYNKHEELMPEQYKNTLPYLITRYAVDMGTSMLNNRLNELTQDPSCPFMQAGVDDGDFILSKVTKAFETVVVPKEGKTDEAMQLVMSEVYRAAKYGFTGSEYGRVRTEFLSKVESIYNNRDKRDNDSYIQECVRHFIEKEPMPGIETEYQLYQAVAPQIPVEAVNEIMQKLISQTDTNLVVLCMNPEKEGYVQPTEEQLLANIHTAQKNDLGAYVDNVKNEPLIAQLPAKGCIVKEVAGKLGTTVLTLSNGVKVIYKQTDFKDNEVKMRAFSDGGSGRYSQDEKYNLALLDGVIGASGLGNFTQVELGKAMAGVQASVNFSIDARSEGLTGQAVPKDLRSLFELTYLRFQEPLRDDKAVNSMLGQLKEQLRNADINPMKEFSDSLQLNIYAHNPRLVILKEEDVDKASYDEILDIYKDRFADASDFTFVFVGNFDVDSLKAYSEQYLATLPTVKRDDTPVNSRLYIQDGDVMCRFTKKQEQPKAQIFQLLHNDVAYTLKNDIVTDVLGQVLNMRLLETIREEMGAAYSANAAAGMQKQCDGKFISVVQIMIPVKPDLCDTSLVVIDQEIKNIANNGVEAKYLDKVKEYLLKTAKENQRDNNAWMTYICDLERNKVDGYTNLEKTIQSITSKDIQKAAKALIKSGNRVSIVMMPQE